MAQQPSNRLFFLQKMALSHLLTQRLIFGGAAVAVAIAGWFVVPPLMGESGSEADVGKAQTVYVKTMQIQLQSDFKIPIWYTGQVRARRKTAVAFQRSGKVSELSFDEGDFVQAKQPIAVLDNRQAITRTKQLAADMMTAQARRDELKKGPRIQAIRTARANVKDFQQQLENADADLKRAQRLLNSGAVSQTEYDQAKYRVSTLEARIDASSAQLDELKAGTRIEQVDAAEAILASARAAAEVAEHDLDDCTLKSPFSGTITKRMVDEGAVLEQGQPVYELVESQHLELSVGLPIEFARSLDLGCILPADIGGIEIDVTLKSKLLSLDPTTRTQTVIFTLDETAAELGIVDNQMGRVRFEKGTNEEGFLLPISAIVNDQKGLWSCFTVETRNGKRIARRESLNVLHFQGDFAFVKGTPVEGQSLVREIIEGKDVVVDGLQKLTNGQVIQFANGGDK